MLFRERRRREDMARREAAGESFWTDDLDDDVRIKIIDAIEASAKDDAFRHVWEITRTLVVRFLGSHHCVDRPRDLRSVEDDVVLSHVEAHVLALRMRRKSPVGYGDLGSYYPDVFETRIADILNSHRVAFRLVDDKIVPLASGEIACVRRRARSSASVGQG